jgi:hypothetical protein
MSNNKKGSFKSLADFQKSEKESRNWMYTSSVE